MGQSRRNSLANAKAGNVPVVGVLDIGTAKVCCMIASRTIPARLLGFGHQRSRGIRAGLVIDFDEAEQAVRAAVAQAERQAGVTLDEVHVSISGGQLQSSHFAATAEISGRVVGESDIARVIDGARSFCERDGRALVHLNRIAYRIDDYAGVADPNGMAGRVLAGDMHAVTADDGPLRNLALLVERCFLRPVRFTPAGIASARAVATPEEMRSGITVIDIGAGTTSIAVIADGHDLFATSLPMGGSHLTYDIVNALRTPLAEAERIKVLYGTMVEASSDERDVVTYPRPHEAEMELYQTTRADIRQLIRPRVESLLAQAMEKLVASGLEAYGGGRIVLTGGAAQLVGLSMFAGRYLSCAVRIAAPLPLAGMSPSSCTPAFATAIGLVAASANPATLALVESRLSTAGSGYLGRVGQWLREAF